jgi:hypothetical protein
VARSIAKSDDEPQKVTEKRNRNQNREQKNSQKTAKGGYGPDVSRICILFPTVSLQGDPPSRPAVRLDTGGSRNTPQDRRVRMLWKGNLEEEQE